MVGAPGVPLNNEAPQYAFAQREITAEINSAVEGCLEAGATEIVVDDCHGGGVNLLYDQLHPEVKILLGSPRRRRFEPLDESFDGVLLIAYHPMSMTDAGVLSHSYSSVSIMNMWLNGRRIGEIGFDSALAGSLGVPVILVTSCREGVEEAKEFLGNVETVAVKEGVSRNCALSLHPRKAQELIKEKARQACERIAEFKPFVLEPPYELKVEYKFENYAESRIREPGVEFIPPNAIVKRSDNLFDLR